MEAIEPEIFAPLDSTNLKAVIPPGDKIIYSTFTESGMSLYKKTISYNGHLILTDKGVAVMEYDLDSKKINNKYYPLHLIEHFWDDGGIGVGTCGHGMRHIKEVESKDQFNERIAKFISRFRPIIIQLRQAYLSERQKNPNLTKKEKSELDFDLHWLERMMKDHAKWVEKRQKEEEKRIKKEAKK